METLAAMPHARVVEQKHGWLLMVKRNNYYSFFFDPFTGKRIDLPDSFTCYAHSCPTFSTQPTSPDCQVLEFFYPDNIVVQTIKREEAEFSIKKVHNGYTLFTLPRYKMTFFKGEYYCLGKEWNLVIYNPKKTRHRITGSTTKLWRHFCASDCGRYLFEGEDDLWAVFIARQGREVCVCKFNLSNKTWEMVHDLGDKMMFLGSNSCLMERAKVSGAGNKIYFPKLMKGSCLFYSFNQKVPHLLGRSLREFSWFQRVDTLYLD